jgi:hypothetical protein
MPAIHCAVTSRVRLGCEKQFDEKLLAFGGRFDSDLGRYAVFDEVVSLVAKPTPKIQRAYSWKLNRFYSTVE